MYSPVRSRVMRLFGLVVLASTLALASTGAAVAYSWPFRPFNTQHPIRGMFGDPRTVCSVQPTVTAKVRRRPGGKAQEQLLQELERRYRAGDVAGPRLGEELASQRALVRGAVRRRIGVPSEDEVRQKIGGNRGEVQ